MKYYEFVSFIWIRVPWINIQECWEPFGYVWMTLIHETDWTLRSLFDIFSTTGQKKYHAFSRVYSPNFILCMRCMLCKRFKPEHKIQIIVLFEGVKNLSTIKVVAIKKKSLFVKLFTWSLVDMFKSILFPFISYRTHATKFSSVPSIKISAIIDFVLFRLQELPSSLRCKEVQDQKQEKKNYVDGRYRLSSCLNLS